MADAPPKGKQGKILGMPRTTGIVVIGLGALVVGYFLISRFGGGSSTSGTGGSAGGGRPGYASGGPVIVEILKGHHGHKPRPKPKHHPKGD